jgi:hypothetical protein
MFRGRLALSGGGQIEHMKYHTAGWLYLIVTEDWVEHIKKADTIMEANSQMDDPEAVVLAERLVSRREDEYLKAAIDRKNS